LRACVQPVLAERLDEIMELCASLHSINRVGDCNSSGQRLGVRRAALLKLREAAAAAKIREIMP